MWFEDVCWAQGVQGVLSLGGLGWRCRVRVFRVQIMENPTEKKRERYEEAGIVASVGV